MAIMRKAFKYRIYLTNAQRRILEQQLEACRWLYNQTLAERKRAYLERGEALRLYDTQALLPGWKVDHPQLKLVHSQVLQNVQVRVDLAFKAFFRRVREGVQDAGFPRFKGFGRYDSITYPQYENGVRLDGNLLIISKIGAVHVVLHRPLSGRPKTVTLSRSRSGKWYACFSVETEPTILPESPAAAGIDVGLSCFATLSTGEKIANPRFFRQDEKALAKAQQKLSKEAKGTPERAECRKVVARVHERIAFRRSDFAHQESRKLVNRFGFLAVEKLNIEGMLKNHQLAKSIADAAWNQFALVLMSKAEDAGRQAVRVNPRNTSKRCSRCGTIVEKDLSVRVHDCQVCGLVIDRDENAAINILALGLQGVGETP
jgi:putative transposase